MLNICEVFPIRKNLIRNIEQTPNLEEHQSNIFHLVQSCHHSGKLGVWTGLCPFPIFNDRLLEGDQREVWSPKYTIIKMNIVPNISTIIIPKPFYNNCDDYHNDYWEIWEKCKVQNIRQLKSISWVGL